MVLGKSMPLAPSSSRQSETPGSRCGCRGASRCGRRSEASWPRCSTGRRARSGWLSLTVTDIPAPQYSSNRFAAGESRESGRRRASPGPSSAARCSSASATRPVDELLVNRGDTMLRAGGVQLGRAGSRRQRFDSEEAKSHRTAHSLRLKRFVNRSPAVTALASPLAVPAGGAVTGSADDRPCSS